MSKKILDVGNCGPDHGSFTRLIREHFGGTVVAVDDLDQALAALTSDKYDLITVNRLLDRDGSEGLTVIESLKAHAEFGDIPVMMVTNFPEHQDIAQNAGAVRGFGKSSLNTSETVELLREFLA